MPGDCIWAAGLVENLFLFEKHSLFQKGIVGMQRKIPSVSSNPWWIQTARWLALAGVVGPILFAVVVTLLGFLSPGYSPISESISTLGVGGISSGLANASGFFCGVLLLAFAIGFFLLMAPVLQQGWRVTCLVLLLLSGIGLISPAIFPAAPATVTLHWILAWFGFFAFLVACIVVGSQWLRMRPWRGYGWYSLLIAFALLAIILSVRFVPGARLGVGLFERALFFVLFLWYIVIGWRLFAWGGPSILEDSPQGHKREPGQPRGERSN
jgi:hypothetical membrane protein